MQVHSICVSILDLLFKEVQLNSLIGLVDP
jgi:hypothetical protein